MTASHCLSPTRLLALAMWFALACSSASAAGSAPYRDLLDAAQAGDLPAVQALLQAGASPDERRHSGDTALMRAADGGHLEIVRALLAAKANVNAAASNWTALLFAANRGHVEVVRALLAAGAAPDPVASELGGGRTPLMLALSNGRLDLAWVLLEGGANVNATTNYGATPLRFAVWGSTPQHVRMIQTLVAAGADVDAGHAPSFRQTQLPCVELIVTAACVTLGRSSEGTALGDIAGSRRTGNDNVMRALVAAGAKVDARQPGWKTPLMIAAAAGNASGVRLLLDAGADATLKDSNEQTALSLALANGHNEVADLLRTAAGRR